MGHRNEFGRSAEHLVADYYEHLGYRVLDRNWRVRTGEIDLVCAHGTTVVFCEVKARSTGRFGAGVDAVDHRKQRRVRSLAVSWLAQSDVHYLDVRFDVADVDSRGTIDLRQGCF
ncbi:MAG: YraN family protein [Actinomycetota bacterium]